MSRSRYCSLAALVVGMVCLTNARPLHALPQIPLNEEPSYKNLPDGGTSLLDLWKKKGPAKPNLNQEMLRSLLEQFGGADAKNLDPELLKKFIQNNPLFQDRDRLNDFQEYLEELLEKNQGQPQANPFQNLNPEKLFGGLKNQQEQWQQEHPPQFNPGKMIEKPPFQAPEEGKRPPPPLPKQTEDLAKGLKGMFGELDSLKDLAKGFADLNLKGAGGWGNDLPNWMPNMGKFGLEDMADWSKKLGNMNLNLPKFDFKAPTFGGGGGGGGNFSGGFGGFGSGGGSSGGIPLGGSGSLGGLWILPLLIGGGIVVWLLIQKYREMERKPVVVLQASLPPIDPNDIRTRQDLVEAFDRFSVQKYGESARVWNHRIIGGKLKNIAPDPYSEAAHELTSLYEHARYLPLHQDLTEQELSRARQHLRTLTEVGTL